MGHALVFGHDFRKVRGNSEATNQVKPALKLKDARVHGQEVLLPNPRDWQKTMCFRATSKARHDRD